ncbi:MAG: molybdopterin-binding protein [Verrucomicrobia bacterium]|nr:molybdopterin-binding protein [Verrucomicrobiota bacterium]
MKVIAPSAFGLIIVGGEILDGRREDKHVAVCRELLQARHVPLSYVLILEDRPDQIEAQLHWAMAQPDPFFCCGGIGATPDDYTREAAARAAGTTVEPHAEAVAILQRRYQTEATPARLRLVAFPKTATLIPNPINECPGFSIKNGHFLPGFPQMAAPMMAWVLDHCYAIGQEQVRHSLHLPGGREGDLIEMMDAFTAAHPKLTFSCLPSFTATGTELHLSIRGPAADAETGLLDLKIRLDAAGAAYQLSEKD